jgi:hypothetical protein
VAELEARFTSPGEAFSAQAVDEERLYQALLSSTTGMLAQVKYAATHHSLTTANARLWWSEAVDGALSSFGLAEQSGAYRFLHRELLHEEMGAAAYQTAMAVLRTFSEQRFTPTERELSDALDEALDLDTTSLVAAGGSIPPSILATMKQTGTVWRNRVRRRVRTGYTGFAGYLAQGVFSAVGREHKTWVAHHDERTRATHLEADGQTVPIDQPFVVGGERLRYPGDRVGTEAEIANCRCVMISRS